MAQPTKHAPVARLVAIITRHPSALDWACQRLIEQWGPLGMRSPTFDFQETEYYTPTMGPGLGKTLVVLESLADASNLAAWKLTTNAWEGEYTTLGRHDEPRPLNLDPGYLAPGKLVLASTKDYAHRIYLGQGIHAEITLHWRGGAWRSHDFTFPDYRRPEVQAFLTAARRWLRQQSVKADLP